MTPDIARAASEVAGARHAGENRSEKEHTMSEPHQSGFGPDKRSGDPGGMELLSAMVARDLHFLGHGEFPRLTGATREDEGDGWAILEFVVEIREDLSLPVSALETEEGGDVGGVARFVSDVLPHADGLETRLEAIRAAAERWIDAHADAEFRLTGWGLQVHEAWVEVELARFVIGIDLLGDDLRPTRHEFLAADERQALDELELTLPTQIRRAELRRELRALGASGHIDQMTVAVIRAHLPFEATLRRLGRAGCIWPMGGLTLAWSDGRVRSHGSAIDGLTWDGSTLVLDGFALPETVATSAAGRPVTTVVDHPLLTDDMIVEQATSHVDDDGSNRHVIVRLVERDRLFSAPRAELIGE